MNPAAFPQKVMALHVELGENRVVGETPGGRLTIIPIVGGTFDGEGIRGNVCMGGADWNTQVSESLAHVHARYWLETDDGAMICVENEGWLNPQEEGTLRTTPRFTCDMGGKYAYLNAGCYAGELRGGAGNSVEIVIWRLG